MRIPLFKGFLSCMHGIVVECVIVVLQIVFREVFDMCNRTKCCLAEFWVVYVRLGLTGTKMTVLHYGIFNGVIECLTCSNENAG